MAETDAPGGRLAPHLEESLRALCGGHPPERRVDGLWIPLPGPEVGAMAALMQRLEARLSAISGLPLADGETALLYHYCLGALPVNIRARTRGRAIPSIAPTVRAAAWAEREIADLYGVRFDGHPDPRRLLRPPPLPPGFFRESETPGG